MLNSLSLSWGQTAAQTALCCTLAQMLFQPAEAEKSLWKPTIQLIFQKLRMTGHGHATITGDCEFHVLRNLEEDRPHEGATAN